MNETTPKAEKPEFRIRNHFLNLIEQLSPGDRLPRIRDVMKEFQTSQRVVERAIKPLLDQGLITARRRAGLHVGVGQVSGTEYEADCLILYRSSESQLARNLLVELVKRLRRSGLRVVMIGFNTEEAALEKLQAHGRIRCCLLQVNFEIVSIGFLAKIRELSDHLVVDGVSVTGIDADIIGTNWREALSVAYRELWSRGYHKIGFLTSSHNARQIAMARREFDLLSNWKEEGINPFLFQMPRLPGSYKREDMIAALPNKELPESPDYKALIVWGSVDGYLLESVLAAHKLGSDLGVILLGSVDVQSEHIGRFDTVGNRNADKLNLFEQIIRSRVRGDLKEPTTYYLPVHLLQNGST